MTSERILMTGNDAVGAGAIQAGCDHFMSKPIGDDFERKIKAFLENADGE